MNRYHCFLIVGGELKPITIEADTVHPDSTCATRFQKSVSGSANASASGQPSMGTANAQVNIWSAETMK